MEEQLKGKKILIVDDEPDVLEVLKEQLEMCIIDTAPSFEAAKKFLDKNTYDVAILDIMGVRGYELLEIANQKGIPALMLTAHALSPDNLVKSIKNGAQSYIPKEKMYDIDTFVVDIIKAKEKGSQAYAAWFARLKQFFDKRFGPNWKEKDKEFWQEFDKKYIASKEELGNIM